jgi:hypothetical protein
MKRIVSVFPKWILGHRRAGARWGRAAFPGLVAACAASCAQIEVDERVYACVDNRECGSGFVCNGVTGTCEPELAGGGGGSTSSSLTLNFEGFLSHVGERVEFRIVSASNSLRTLGIIDALDSPDTSLVLPGGLPEFGGPHSLHFFADHDFSGGYTDPPLDHAWVRPFEGDSFQFVHVADFDPLPVPSLIGGAFVATLEGFSPEHGGRRLDLSVVEKVSGRTVGFYRKDPIPEVAVGDSDAKPFDIELPGIIDPLSPYQVVVVVDANGDGKLDPGSGDPSWRIDESASDSGTLTLTIVESADSPVTGSE